MGRARDAIARVMRGRARTPQQEQALAAPIAGPEAEPTPTPVALSQPTVDDPQDVRHPNYGRGRASDRETPVPRAKTRSRSGGAAGSGLQDPETPFPAGVPRADLAPEPPIPDVVRPTKRWWHKPPPEDELNPQTYPVDPWIGRQRGCPKCRYAWFGCAQGLNPAYRPRAARPGPGNGTILGQLPKGRGKGKK